MVLMYGGNDQLFAGNGDGDIVEEDIRGHPFTSSKGNRPHPDSQSSHLIGRVNSEPRAQHDSGVATNPIKRANASAVQEWSCR